MARGKLMQNVWRQKLIRDLRITRRRWMNVEEETGTVGKWYFLRCEEKPGIDGSHSWRKYFTQEINVVCVINWDKVFDVATCEILPFGYWLHSASWVSQHLRYLPLQIALNWHRVVLSVLPSKLISLLMHVLGFFSPRSHKHCPEYIKVLQPK